MTSLLATLLLQILCLVPVLGSGPIITETGTTGDYTTPRETFPVTLPQDYVEYAEAHVGYKVHKELATWNEAQERCKSEGGYLAIPDSWAKIRKIKSIKHQLERWVHVGIHRSGSSNEWIKVDNGLPATFLPWAYNTPNRTGSCTGIALLSEGLVDYSCDAKREYFVCEIRTGEDNSGTESPLEEEVSSPMPNHGQLNLPEYYVPFAEDKAAYKIHYESVKWDEARERCMAEGARLAIADSAKKIQHIKDMDEFEFHWMHVGIYKSNTTNEWGRIDNGLPVPDVPWDESWISPTEEARCAGIVSSLYKLVKFDCKRIKTYFACEIPLQAN